MNLMKWVQLLASFLLASFGYWSTITLLQASSPGDLDPSFNTTGIVTTSVDNNNIANSIALQPDGKIVSVGLSYGSGFVVHPYIVVIRYNSDGSLDTTFNSTGIVTTDVGPGYDLGTSATIQPDDKIVISAVTNDGDDFTVIRYDSDGKLDTSFNGSGIVTTPIGSDWDQASSVAIQPNGKILAAGVSTDSGLETISYFVVVRYNNDGSLDTTFNNTGIVTTLVGSSGAGHSLALQPDGKIVVAGASGNGGIFNGDLAMVRYNADGSLDTTFNQTGIVTTAIETGSFGHGTGMTLQPDGKIILVGSSDIGTFNYVFGVVRYNSDGSLDTTFNGTGIVTTPLGGDSNANGVAVQPNGKIIVVGTGLYSGPADLALVRYNSDGSLDTTFNGTGIITTDFGTTFNEEGIGVVLQPDGKIIAGGSRNYGVARYFGDLFEINVYLPFISRN